jgi:hypothetical protein
MKTHTTCQQNDVKTRRQSAPYSATWARVGSVETDSRSALRSWLVNEPRLPLGNDLSEHEMSVGGANAAHIVNRCVFRPGITGAVHVLITLHVIPLKRS